MLFETFRYVWSFFFNFFLSVWLLPVTSVFSPLSPDITMDCRQSCLADYCLYCGTAASVTHSSYNHLFWLASIISLGIPEVFTLSLLLLGLLFIILVFLHHVLDGQNFKCRNLEAYRSGRCEIKYTPSKQSHFEWYMALFVCSSTTISKTLTLHWVKIGLHFLTWLKSLAQFKPSNEP